MRRRTFIQKNEIQITFIAMVKMLFLKYLKIVAYESKSKTSHFVNTFI